MHMTTVLLPVHMTTVLLPVHMTTVLLPVHMNQCMQIFCSGFQCLSHPVTMM
jgi:hypothetical protein